MAEDPQPSEDPVQPTAAEQKQEAAALSNLSTHGDENEKKASNADTAALGAALSNLSVNGKEAGEASKLASQEKQKAEAKKIKVDPADVTFLVEELEISKKKATEMLQANRGDRVEAIKSFIIPAVKA